MIGPITNEIAKANRRKIEEAFHLKVKEIETLYIKTGVPVPKQVQLSHPKEVCEAYELVDKTPPEIARKKHKLLERIELLGGLAFIGLVAIIIATLIKNWESFPVVAILVLLFFPIILFAIVYTSISKIIQKGFDDKH